MYLAAYERAMGKAEPTKPEPPPVDSSVSPEALAESHHKALEKAMRPPAGKAQPARKGAF